MAKGTKQSIAAYEAAQKEERRLAAERKKIQDDANNMASEALDIEDHALKLETKKLLLLKEINKEQALIEDYALKAAQARAEGLDTETDIYNTQMNLAKLAKKALVNEQKISDFKDKQHDAIKEISQLEKKISKEREKSKHLTESMLKPITSITDKIRDIPLIGAILEPVLKNVEDKAKGVIESLVNKKSVGQLQSQLDGVRNTLGQTASKEGVDLNAVLGRSASGAEDIAGGLSESASAGASAAEGAGALAAGTEAAAVGAESFGATLLAAMGPIGWIIAGIGLVVAGAIALAKHVNAVRDATIDISRAQGLAADAAWDYQQATNSALRDAAKYGIALVSMSKEVAEMQKGFQDIIGSNNQLNQNNIQMGAYLMKNMEASTDEANKFLTATTLSGHIMSDNVLSLQDSVNLINKSTNLGLRYKDVMKAIGEATATTLSHYHESIPALTKAYGLLKQYGLGWDAAAKSAESILNIESSIGAEMEARVLTGKNINLNQARYLALQGDESAALDELVKQVGSYKELSAMLPMQQKKLAEAIGMSADEMLNAVKHQELLSMLTNTNIKDVSKLSDKDIMAVDGVLANMDVATKEALLSDRARTKASELTAGAMAKMSLMADSMINKFGTSKEKDANKVLDWKPGMADDSGPSQTVGEGSSKPMTQQERLEEQQMSHPTHYDDFISRPGMGTASFNKDDIIIGGTDLMGEKSSNGGSGNSEVVALLKQLIKLVDQPVYFNIGGRIIDELDSRITMRKSYNTKMDSGYGANG